MYSAKNSHAQNRTYTFSVNPSPGIKSAVLTLFTECRQVLRPRGHCGPLLPAAWNRHGDAMPARHPAPQLSLERRIARPKRYDGRSSDDCALNVNVEFWAYGFFVYCTPNSHFNAYSLRTFVQDFEQSCTKIVRRFCQKKMRFHTLGLRRRFYAHYAAGTIPFQPHGASCPSGVMCVKS